MRRETQNILLILLGGALLKLAISGDFTRYVKPSQQPWLVGGGAAMLLLGALAIWRDLRPAAQAPEPACDTGGDHAHSHSTPSSWMLLLPVLAVLFIAPPALGSDSVSRAVADGSSARSRPSSTPVYSSLPQDKVNALRISEFQARAAWDDFGTLDNRTVSLTGFVSHQGGVTHIARLVIGCCAADSFPVTVRLGGRAATEAGGLPDDQWIKVTGQLVPGSATKQNRYVPELAVESVTEIDEPADPYEY